MIPIRWLSFLAAFCPLSAQNIGGSLAGQVVDSQGLAIDQALVEVSGNASGARYTTRTDNSGRFLAPVLPQASYTIAVSREGFDTATAGPVRVTIGETPFIRVTLLPAATTQTLTVAASVSALPTNAADRGASYGASLMNDLPMLGGSTGRNFRTQAYLTPGVSASTTAHRPFAVSGSRNRNNNYMVDSNDFNEAEGGLLMGRGASEQLISTEAIDGMQVLTHNFKAEYGRQNGAVVSIITKRGGNQFHGLLYHYLRNDKLDARNAFDLVKPPLRGNNYGFNLGGPLRRDRTFFFLNNEWNLRRTASPATIQTLSAAQRAQAVPAIAPLAGLFPEPNLPGTNLHRANPSSSVDQNSQVYRVDHELSPAQRIFWRTTRLNAINRGATGASLSRYESGVGPAGHSLQHIWTPTARLLNEARLNYTRFTLNDTFLDPVALGDPARNGLAGTVAVNGLTTLGHFAFMARRTAQNTFQYADDLSYTRGGHAFKAGANIRRLQLNNGTFAPSFTGVLRFNSVPDFLAGRAASYSRNVGNPYIGLRATEWNYYLQDDWRVHPRLTLNLGVRYEFNSVPREVNGLIDERYRFAPDRNNVAPRFGFAWQAGETVLRGGYGLYYNVLELSFVGLTRFNAPRIRNFAAASPAFPDLLATAQAGLATGLVIPGRNARQPYSQHMNLSLERQVLNPQTVLSVAYVGTLGRKLPRASRPNGGDGLAQRLRPDPSLGVVNVLETAANSSYHGLQASLQAKLGRLTMRNAYTWSRFLDEVSDFPSSNTGIDRGLLALDENNWRLNRAVSDFDLRHVLNSAFSYDLPRGFRVQGIVGLQSGRPFTLYSGTDSPFGTNNNRIHQVPGSLSFSPSARRAVALADASLRAALIPGAGRFGTLGRNTATGDTQAGISLGLHKSFALSERTRLEFRGEVFNLMNTVNYALPDGVLSSPNFGQALTAGDPRQAQLGLRLSF
ncbi:MAG: TonB-dependent receptor [Acidobacteria bacterium]|nr:TonB-dependent receptor [Acidobacteriota bacterium]